MIRAGGRAQLGDAVLVVGRCVAGAVLVVGHRVVASLVVGRRDSGAGRRVVVGSPFAGRGGVPVAGSSVVGRLVTGTVIGGSGRVVACRAPGASIRVRGGTLETGCAGWRNAVPRTLETGCSGVGVCDWRGTLETGCVGWWLAGRGECVMCDRDTFCSGTAGVVA